MRVAKSLGYVVIAVDRDPCAIGFKYSDVQINRSTHDVDGIIKVLEQLVEKYKLEGVINLSAGPPVITTAIICDRYEIPFVPISSAKIIINKDLLHDFCLGKRIIMPDYQVFSLKEKKRIESFDLPLVVKPGLSLIGKGGVTIVRNLNNFDKAIRYASEHTINNKFIIEKYLPGSDYSLLGFVNNGRYFPIIILDELNKENIDGTVSRVGYKVHSPMENNKLLRSMEKITNNIAKELMIDSSPIITAFRLDEEGVPNLIEIHLDLGGDHIVDEILSRALPYNFIKLAINMSVGLCQPPKNKLINPVGILFNDIGEGASREKGFKIISATSHELLSEKIKRAVK